MQKTPKLVVMQASLKVVMSAPVDHSVAVGEEPRKVRPRMWVFVAVGIVSLSLLSLVSYALVASSNVSDGSLGGSLLPDEQNASAKGPGSVNLSTAPTANQQNRVGEHHADFDPAQAEVQEGSRTASVKTSTAAIIAVVASVTLLVAFASALAVIYTLHNKERELAIKLEENELRQAEEANRLKEQFDNCEQDHVRNSERRSIPWVPVSFVIVLWGFLGWWSYLGGMSLIYSFTLAPILLIIVFLIHVCMTWPRWSGFIDVLCRIFLVGVKH